MNRREAVAALAALGAAPAVFAQAVAVPVVGTLTGSQVTRVYTKAFLAGMAALGYEEGKNIHYVHREGDGTFELILKLANELVAAKVNLIWAPGTRVATAARKATATLPIVFAFVSDPVASGFVASLARPGSTMTGLTLLNAETGAKRIELLDEIFPKLRRVGVLHNPTDTASTAQLAVVEDSLRKRGKEWLVVTAASEPEIAPAFAKLVAWRANALAILENGFFISRRRTLLDLATKHRWPTVNSSTESAEEGGVISYGADWSENARRSASHVDRILKGARPAELPVERPVKFELVVNLKAARALGLNIPQTVLLRADKVIE